MHFISNCKLFTSIGLAILILAMGVLVLASEDTESPNVIDFDFGSKTIGHQTPPPFNERRSPSSQITVTIAYTAYLPIIVVAPPQPSSDLEVIITLPNGNSYPKSGQVKVIYTIRDTDGVTSFTWALFTQNLTPLIGGEVLCHNAPECIHEETINLPSITGTYIIGGEAVDSTGQIEREIAEIYVY